MKTPIAITLMIAGTFVFLVPAFDHYAARTQVVALLSRPNVERVSLSEGLSKEATVGYSLAGAAMILGGVLGSLFSRRPA